MSRNIMVDSFQRWDVMRPPGCDFLVARDHWKL
jgi:hypothetical protein